MDYWRDYFAGANSDIFQIIQAAIITAASDYPKEFRLRRDGIAQTLFSCKLLNCSGCDKLELALPTAHDDDKLKSVDVSKGSRNAGDLHQVSSYSYGDAEALTDEIEEDSRMFAEVIRIKRIVDHASDQSASVLCESLRKLQVMGLSVEILKATEIGKSVNALRKHTSKDIRQISRTLIEVWKDMVDEWVNTRSKTACSEATPESTNPSIVDEEGGLPSPPLDDLAFLDPCTMTLELSEFFDGMDDYGNSRESNKKQDITRLKPKEETVVKKQPSLVKPSKPPVGRQKLQTSQPVSVRKLQERYQEAEKAKRQRTIRVMELQDLPKHPRPTGNNHNRYRF